MRTPDSTSASMGVPWAAVTPASSLTRREREVVRLLAAGKTYEQVAAELRIGTTTVNRHAYHARSRVGATCLVELLAAIGWLQVPA